MKFFLDTANVEEIRRIEKLGLVDGVTTNPTLISKEGRPFKEVIQEIAGFVDGPVNAEVVGLKAEEMITEARKLAAWGDNIIVKIPMSEEGLEAVHALTKEGIKTNVTLVFSVAQGLMAAKAGASFISPFVGRLDDIGKDGVELVAELKQVMDEYGYKTEIIAASVRHLQHLESIALTGADIATIPGSIFPKLWDHPLTDKGIDGFLKDWEAYEKGQNK
ncbi:Probable transaldolase [Tetragenococcus halophilus subsp. halophilus]|uniref:Probable transaldolase n=1 Tax=Tetragenococcus halophilus TaxID=51669 RepID=A0AB35HQC3_TETHA|nr:fructose-6-phosphate aldolase [Tetragenococcus halophilus]MCO7026400.1 fructose-6-phosphate aldolase [Tetragenococcus halophilus]MCO8296456.1 fructose-6-phosphate aldolase [Tetragenococcus halophilus]MCO8297912.1 fructose-6-phosphate aldolase [Tetragenococcus halophilus]GBD79958.1 Probable transaldolase [Tetragenococcus halophilus subsp. halophilus]GBD82489.1 Probable transaldolase [Tetragenococcus halophilus subsp. halophilus]